MSLPEQVLQRAIIQGIQAMRRDTRLIDTIFKQLHQDQLADVKKYILETSFAFNVNFPREGLKVPAMVLILKNENEAQTFLGDVMGSGSSELIPDQELTIDTLGGHAGSASTSSGLPRKFAGPLAVETQEGTSTITFQEDQLALIEELRENPIPSLQLYVVSGAGAGHVYDVARIREDSLDIRGNFVLSLDNTSLVDLRYPDDPELSIGEPSRVYQKSPSLLKKGVHYEVAYYLHVVAAQQEQVLYLYNIIKALLLSQRTFLESQGIQVLKISGSDLSHRSEYLPDTAFQRQMTLTFTYPFSFYEELETYDQIAVDMELCDSTVIAGVPFDI